MIRAAEIFVYPLVCRLISSTPDRSNIHSVRSTPNSHLRHNRLSPAGVERSFVNNSRVCRRNASVSLVFTGIKGPFGSLFQFLFLPGLFPSGLPLCAQRDNPRVKASSVVSEGHGLFSGCAYILNMVLENVIGFSSISVFKGTMCIRNHFGACKTSKVSR